MNDEEWQELELMATSSAVSNDRRNSSSSENSSLVHVESFMSQLGSTATSSTNSPQSANSTEVSQSRHEQPADDSPHRHHP